MIPPNASTATALQAFETSDLQALLVGTDGSYEGLLARDKVEEAVRSGARDTSIATFIVSDFAHAHPDHPLEVVLDRLSKNPGILPVVSRKQINEVLGIVTPQTVMQFLQKTWEEPATQDSNRPPN